MERRQIGVVQELFRYPVKSMLGERLREVDIGAHGVIGDRAYALREGDGRVVTAKKWANMFAFCARYDTPPTPGALAPLRITLATGQTIHAEDPDASAVLSAVLGRPVVLERAQSDQRHRAEIDPATVFGEVPVQQVKPGYTAATLPDTFALPPGTFFDSASMHVVASGTLAHLRTLTGGDAQLDPRRFRPMLLLDSRVVACADGVNWRHLMPRSLTGVQPCKSTLSISSMMCSVIRWSASCAGPTAWRAP